MLRTIVIAAALGAMALPAAAATKVTVNVAGQDAKAAHATILRAAEAACKIELRDASTLEQYYLRTDCINVAVARAEAHLDATAVNASKPTRLAGR
jgi:hypothetical protein